LGYEARQPHQEDVPHTTRSDQQVVATLITHARTRAARFLGYEITVQHDDSKITGGRRMLNGTIALRVPPPWKDDDAIDPPGELA